MIGAPPNSPFDMDGDRPSRNWWQWMQTAYRTIKQDQGSGATGDRPVDKLGIGHYYFDTTLGHMIWYDGSAWVDGSGNSV